MAAILRASVVDRGEKSGAEQIGQRSLAVGEARWDELCLSL
jgi:hypothetical protein